ncbi:hypothetical protein LAZ67_3003747 [Cordylochernes scorpioides]|uniref:CCHC-type domain-containing protein n=1 Tax=Cordylochernes scorpioides TaxID=51811 RepID=A0ABY6KBM9_9ARAC|nr:hypothetical protein LAZ67_3003747 [Cordylochernes scorpioides]
MSLEATNLVWAGSPRRAEHEPGRLGSDSQTVAEISAENQIQNENSRIAIASGNYANLATKALAERLLRDGLEIGHTHLRAFPFKKRAERTTVVNLPFFVDDAAVIEALRPYGDVTSIVPIRLRAGRYTFTDGRREVFILLKEGFTLEKIPTRVVIRNKGNVLSAFISYGVKCSRCGRQGHRRANCPINPGRASNNGQPQPAPLPPGASSTVSRQPNPSTPAAPALPMEETPSAPVTPAPPLQAPEGPVGPRPAGSQHPEPPPTRPDLVAPRGPLPAQKTLGPAAPTPDVDMSIVEETFASSTSSAKNATRVDLDAFIEGHPSVSFAETDALGLGREEVLNLLSSRTKAQRKGPLLSPPQCDTLVGLIGQILDLRPGAASNLYKVLGQVKAELRTTPAVPPTPPLPAPRPAETAPPAPQGKESAPAEVAYPPPLPVKMTDEARKKWLLDLFKELNYKTFLVPLLGWIRPEQIIHAALHSGEERNDILGAHPNQRSILANFLGSVIERARGGDQSTLDQLSEFSTAMEMEYEQPRREFFQHSLFGGSSTNVVEHEVYTIHLSDINNSYRCEFEALGKPLICGSIPPVCPRSFLEGSEELDVSDLMRDRIEVLIGADIAGRLLTDAQRRISSGLVAIRTKLGWTVMGKISPTEVRDDTSSLCVTTLLSLDLENLWKLDAIGVSDAEVEKKTQSLQAEMEEHFAHTTRRDIEERYEVALPGVQNKERIPSNRDLAENQQSSVRKKLEEVGDMNEYEQIFEEWMNQGIIEYAREDKLDGVHYLPH